MKQDVKRRLSAEKQCEVMNQYALRWMFGLAKALAWLNSGKIGVLFMFLFLFLTGVGAYVWVFVCHGLRAHTHSTRGWGTGMLDQVSRSG